MAEETKKVEAPVEQPKQAEPAEETTTDLMKSREEEFQARRRAEAELQKFRDAATEKERKDLEKRSEIDEVTKKWRQKCFDLEKKIKQRDADVVASRIDSVVSELSTKINSEVPELFKPMIKERIKGELTAEGQLKIVCLDKQGLPTSGTTDELVKEILDNDKYKRYVIANKSSGSAKDDSVKPVQRFVPKVEGSADLDLTKATPEQLVAYLKSAGTESQNVR